MADVDRLLDAPALVDVAHQLDVRPDRVAHHAHSPHLLGGRRTARQRHLRLHLDEALVDQPPRGGGGLRVGQPTTQRAGRIGRNPIARTAKQLPQRLLQCLALDVPQRNVDRGHRQRVDTRAARIARRRTELPQDRLDPQRVLPDDQRAQFIDRAAQRAGQRTTVERDPNALDAGVGLQAKGDDRSQPPGLFRHVSQRVVFRDAQDAGFGLGDLHRFLHVLPWSIAAGTEAGKTRC